VYGLTKNIDTYNPLKVATHEYVSIAKDLKAARDWRERAGRVFRGPGWGPAPAAPPALTTRTTEAPATASSPGGKSTSA
jgi:hypothetical protein